MGKLRPKRPGVCRACATSTHALGGVLGALGAHFASFFRLRFLYRFFIDFFSILEGFGAFLGGQNCQKIQILAVFGGMLLETLFLVEFCWIFDKNDGDKHMEFLLFFNMLFHHLFAKFAVFCNARNLQNSDFP